jgi:hypothetical protein
MADRRPGPATALSGTVTRATLGTALNAWRGGDGTAFDAVVPPNRCH